MRKGRFLRFSGRSAAAILAASVTVLAATAPAGARTTTTGYDISYPQCGQSYPGGQAFGIVGVNGGLANNANSCLKKELGWAKRSPGLASLDQARASLYINTADPGPAVSDWPTSGTTPDYGPCNGGWSRACAYLYGEDRAEYSYGLVATIDSKLAATAPWWLDIEVANSWASSPKRGYKGLNLAAIRGFIAGLVSSGSPAPVGVYSDAANWTAITGLMAKATSSAFGSSVPGWTTGSSTRKQAQKQCASTGFTGRKPTLVQYIANGFDADLRCG